MLLLLVPRITLETQQINTRPNHQNKDRFFFVEKKFSWDSSSPSTMILCADELIPGIETNFRIRLFSTMILFKRNTWRYQNGITVSIFDYTHMHAI
jgi:hypothetical protein